MNFLIILFVFLIETSFSHEYESFDNYILNFNKYYSIEEFKYRANIFNYNLNQIRKHNLNSSNTWKMGINQFSDQTNSELQSLINLKTVPKNNFKKSTLKLNKPYLTDMDWRKKGIITSVKNQADCGGCWAFSAIETIESHYAIKTNKLETLSEQQVLDCVWDYNFDSNSNLNNCLGVGNGGCLGGTVELAYETIIKMGGSVSEYSYPYVSYTGNDNYICNKSKSMNPIVKISAFEILPMNDYLSILNYIENKGPLTISVDASSWFSYRSGIFNGCNSQRIELNHAVQLVGFGTDPNYGLYWLVRNSWGSSWGEGGYIRLKRTTYNNCGQSSVADCSGKKITSEKMCGECGILYHSTYPIITI